MDGARQRLETVHDARARPRRDDVLEIGRDAPVANRGEVRPARPGGDRRERGIGVGQRGVVGGRPQEDELGVRGGQLLGVENALGVAGDRRGAGELEERREERSLAGGVRRALRVEDLVERARPCRAVDRIGDVGHALAQGRHEIVGRGPRAERIGDELDIAVDLVQRFGVEDEDGNAEPVDLVDDARRRELVARGEDEVRLGGDEALEVDLRLDDDLLDVGDVGREVVEVGDADEEVAGVECADDLGVRRREADDPFGDAVERHLAPGVVGERHRRGRRRRGGACGDARVRR
jgi:hypothetical protein